MDNKGRFLAFWVFGVFLAMKWVFLAIKWLFLALTRFLNCVFYSYIFLYGVYFFIAIDVILCIIHNMTSRELIKILENDGWTLRGVKGSHHIFVHPVKSGHVSVPHPKHEMGKGLVHAILKQSGLKGVTV